MKLTFILAIFLSFTFHTASFAEEPTPSKRPEITVYVTGAVNKPGGFKLPANASILDALTASGGASDNVNLERVRLLHKPPDHGKVEVAIINVKQIMDGAISNVAIHDGDQIVVPQATYKIIR